MFLLVVPLLGLVPTDCGDDEVGYERFNQTSDALVVEVAAGAVADDASIELFSSTGTVLVGSFVVSPGGGPVGTEHTLTVSLVEDYVDQVDRVVVTTDSGDRGIEKFEFDQDSANRGLWVTSVVSSGVEGEVRSDTMSVGLFTEVPADEVTDTGSR